jgi:hypothetical protein
MLAAAGVLPSRAAPVAHARHGRPRKPTRKGTLCGQPPTRRASVTPRARAPPRLRVPRRRRVRLAARAAPAARGACTVTAEPARRLPGRLVRAVAAQRGRRLSLPSPRRRRRPRPACPEDAVGRGDAVLGGGAGALPWKLRGRRRCGTLAGGRGLRGPLSGGGGELRGRGPRRLHRGHAARGWTVPRAARARGAAPAAPLAARRVRRGGVTWA